MPQSRKTEYYVRPSWKNGAVIRAIDVEDQMFQAQYWDWDNNEWKNMKYDDRDFWDCKELTREEIRQLKIDTEL